MGYVQLLAQCPELLQIKLVSNKAAQPCQVYFHLAPACTPCFPPILVQVKLRHLCVPGIRKILDNHRE